MKKLALIVCVVLILFAAYSGFAIVTGDTATSETDPSSKTEYSAFDWSHVHNYKNSSAVAVDNYWVLTAAHVADDGGTGAITVGTTTHNQMEIIPHDTADLALVRFDKPFLGNYNIFSGTLASPNPNFSKLSTIMVGYGNTGTVSATTWSDSGSGNGNKRWGSQEIDSAATVTYDAEGTTGSTTSDGFWMDFDLGNTTYEAGVGIYDSGGGTFVDDGGEWKLAGINTIRNGPAGAYTSTFSVAVQDYSEWIGTTVPEPSMALFICFAGAVYLIRTRFMGRFGGDKMKANAKYSQ